MRSARVLAYRAAPNDRSEKSTGSKILLNDFITNLLRAAVSPHYRVGAPRRFYFCTVLSTTPNSVSILGAASSTASRLWQALQSCVTFRPSALAWLSS
jgi:hypothetical protein